MKISLQRKIAELESRIAVLEQATKIHTTVFRYTSTPWEPKVREHWNAVWAEFDKLMKSAFERFS